MKLAVKCATLKVAIPFPGGIKTYVAMDKDAPEWRHWNVFADTVSRELVVDAPLLGSPRQERFRIPFENVVFYKAGAVAPRSDTDDPEIKALLP